MFTLSYAASEHLALQLAQDEAPDDAVIRLVANDGGFRLAIDTVQPGDATFAHNEKIRACHRRAAFEIARKPETGC